MRGGRLRSAPLRAEPTLRLSQAKRAAAIAEPLKVLSLFAGIGGFDLGLERTGGFRTVAFCEQNKHCQRWLSDHWREVPIYDDVRTLTADRLAADGITVDVITGGFPCQDISHAGLKAGIAEGTRSGLWSEFVRLIRDIRPSYVIVENVSALLSGPSEQPGEWFGRVLGDLAGIGYDAEWEDIPARALGAPTLRERVWIIAYPAGLGRPEMALQDFARDGAFETEGWASINAGPLVGACSWTDWEKQCGICLVGDGFSNGLAACQAAGNAVVPQIPELIGRAILASMEAA